MSTTTIPSPRNSFHSRPASVRSKPASIRSKASSVRSKAESVHSRAVSVHSENIPLPAEHVIPPEHISPPPERTSVHSENLRPGSEHLVPLEHTIPPLDRRSVHSEHTSVHSRRTSPRSEHISIHSVPAIASQSTRSHKSISLTSSIVIDAEHNTKLLDVIPGFFGKIVTPTSPGYSDAIGRWAYNAERPARLVTYPRFTTDIFVAISHAYKNSLPIAVRGGGHSCAGTSSSTHGLVIDLSKHFAHVRVDQTNRIAFVGGGAIWKDVDEAAIRYGLAAVGGTVNHTGVGGLTLGGGYGWLTGQYGLACDNIVAATIVIPGAATAPGVIQPTSTTVSAFSDPDLFFAIRGGGGNFGVVTEFAIKLHPQRRTVWSGTIVYESSVLEELFEALDAWWVDAGQGHKPGEAALVFFFRDPATKECCIGMRPFFNGSAADGRKRFASFLAIQHLADQTKELPYEVINAQQNEQAQHGDNVYMTGTSRTSFPPSAARALFTTFAEISASPFDGSAVIVEYLPLHLVRAASSETSAFPGRMKGDNIVFLVHWPREDPTGNTDAARAHATRLKQVIWARECEIGGEVDSSGYANYVRVCIHSLNLLTTRITYVCLLETEATDHDAAAIHFGPLYPRLQAVKAMFSIPVNSAIRSERIVLSFETAINLAMLHVRAASSDNPPEANGVPEIPGSSSSTTYHGLYSLHVKGETIEHSSAWKNRGPAPSIIYSDIGTSPLYVLNGIWPSSGPLPSQEDIIGGISAIIWSLTLLPMLKYVGFALSFGTKEGEGGTFALYHGLFPPNFVSDEEDRSLTHDSNYKSKSSAPGTPSTFSTDRLGKSSWLRWALLPWTLFGTALCLADGVFTPAVSVTSAVGGIAVAKSDVSSKVVPISIAFLIILFLPQRFGTTTISRVFAPVTMGWFLLLGITGIMNIVHYPGVFRAFDPSRAVLLFVRTKNYDMLAGVLLAVTGCEALFANLGQFNATSIRLSFIFVTYPALVLAYLGQGARLIADGEEVFSNVFYKTIPGPTGGPLYWIMFLFAILATLIASQAMITAAFSLTQQLINLRSFPPLLMKYTSETIQGQVYVPAVNWALGIGCIIVVAAFKDLAALTNAYVSTVMFITTTLITLQIPLVKRIPVVFGVAFLLFFGFIDGLFWGASLKKIPHGAWVPLMIGCALMAIMWFWTWAKGLEDEFDGANRRNLRHFIMLDSIGPDEKFSPAVISTYSQTNTVNEEITSADDQPAMEDDLENEKLGLYLLTDRQDRRLLPRVETAAVFHKLSAGKGVPHAFYAFLRQWPALPRVVIFLSVRIMPTARVPAEDRFRDDFQVNIDDVIEKLYVLELRAAGPGPAQALKTASKITTHIVPSYYVVSRPVGAGFLSPVVDWIRAMLVEGVYRRMSTMFPETANWLGSADEIIRVGVNAVI
ncbi:potassium transporter [Rhizoctonia solani]|uniref:Potassium transporter n=1 Tax=Rhizoctonia solani TaxID=456999 RepID=A0A8H7I3T2_9AGAM|nr:potassium transporter [Rhizoctonia solani]